MRAWRQGQRWKTAAVPTVLVLRVSAASSARPGCGAISAAPRRPRARTSGAREAADRNLGWGRSSPPGWPAARIRSAVRSGFAGTARRSRGAARTRCARLWSARAASRWARSRRSPRRRSARPRPGGALARAARARARAPPGASSWTTCARASPASGAGLRRPPSTRRRRPRLGAAGGVRRRRRAGGERGGRRRGLVRDSRLLRAHRDRRARVRGRRRLEPDEPGSGPAPGAATACSASCRRPPWAACPRSPLRSLAAGWRLATSVEAAAARRRGAHGRDRRSRLRLRARDRRRPDEPAHAAPACSPKASGREHRRPGPSRLHPCPALSRCSL